MKTVIKKQWGLKIACAVAVCLFAACIETQAGAIITNSKYLTAQKIPLGDGSSLEKYIISGPQTPPAGYELERTAVALPEHNQAMGNKTLTVPAYSWVFGCSAVSAAMIAAYYDRIGLADMYTGPTNGGVMPLDSSSWSTWMDGNGGTYTQNPLIASRNGLDGRDTLGSLDDTWVQYGSSVDDPYITEVRTQHAWGDAIGDYMKTSQSDYGIFDGATCFYGWDSPAQLTCSKMEELEISSMDGTYGRKLFYEARGYTVTDCYSQLTDNKISGGFSFVQFKAEIDAGRPVMLNLEGHSIVGIGYDDSSSNTIYIHDTWDYLTHTMTWGGSYSGMALLSVSVVNLTCIDNDHDGYGIGCAAGPDCDDNNPAVHPGATEVCNGIDDDCNGQTDEGLEQHLYYRDADGDGFGSDNASEHCSLTPPAGYSKNNSDCDDDDSFYNETCPDCTVKVTPKALGWFLGEKKKARSLIVIGKMGAVFDETTPVKWESSEITVLSKHVFFKRFMLMKVSIDGAALDKGEYRTLIGTCEGKLALMK